MYITINFSSKTDGFTLFTNCFYPLYKTQELSFIDFSKKMDASNIDFERLCREIESSLASASTSRYSLIIIYDYQLQEKNPIAYSISGIINNIEMQICDKISYSYRLENIYFVTLDDAERDSDGVIINEQLKQNIEFDRKGFLDSSDYEYLITSDDLNAINDGFKDITKQFLINETNKSHRKAFNEFNNKYLKVVENRIVKAIDKCEDKNYQWYKIKIEKVFEDYRHDIEKFMEDVVKRDKSVESLRFTIKDYILDNISSYNRYDHNKIFRLNMLDNKGRVSKNEAKYRSYYKIIAFIICMVVEDKKYLFGNVLNNENHYIVDVSIEDKVIEDMLIDYRNNLLYELDKLGDIKFNGIYVESFEKDFIDTVGGPGKKFDFSSPKFSLIKNDSNLNDTKAYAENWKNRYIEHINYVNQRLRNITEKLRVSMLKSFSGEKKQVSANDLQSIIDEKENNIKELKKKIAENTPDDSIPIDFQIFEENEKNVQKANVILKQRISMLHFAFNILIIIYASFIIWPFMRRFVGGIPILAIKLFLFLLPAIVYTLVQLVYCIIYVHKANKLMLEIENYTRKKIKNINVDDEKFKDYVNNIYELMLLTKYVSKLKENANEANIDVDNYKYHKENIIKAINESNKVSKLMRIDINRKGNELNNISLKLNVNKYENDLYCPVLYVKLNDRKYILINNEQNNNITDKMLNFVDSIKFDYDEVYNERN